MPSAAPSLAVVVVASTDPVLRDLATAAALCDVPRTAVLRYDLGPTAQTGLRRVVSDLHGVVEDVVVPLEHACLDCAQREDLLPTVAAVAAGQRWDTLVLALPVGAEPTPLVQALAVSEETADVVVRSVVTVVGSATLLEDVLGDDLLGERGLASNEDDDRAVGEALAHQLEESDLVLTDSALDAHAAAFLRHLCGPTPAVASLDRVTGAQLLAPRRDTTEPGARADLRAARRHPVIDGEGVWTVQLSSPRAFHPARLLQRIEDLGSGRLRARGTFWLPTRPQTVCAWDGAGGQLSIGDIGNWRSAGERRTHLVITGTDPGDRQRIRGAFAQVLCTPQEQVALSAGTARAGSVEDRAADGAAAPAGVVDDGFEPWLGDVLDSTSVVE